MPATQMHELLKHELGDLLYAEQLILKMLGTLNREVSNPEMKQRVEEHAGETEEQIERLRRAFEAIGEKAKAEKCDAAVGLKAEHDSFKKEKPSKPLLEAFDLGNSLRVEHYEIAGYRSAIAVAQVLGHTEVVSLLTESLREEEAMAAFVERNSVKGLKLLAEQMEPREITFTPETGGSRGAASKSKSGGSASKSGGSKTGERASASKSGGAKSGGGAKSAAKSGGASKSGGSKSGASKSGGSAAKKSSGAKSSGSRANA